MRISSPRRIRLLVVVGAVFVLLSPLTVAEQRTNRRLKFRAVGLNLNTAERSDPDVKLVDYLMDHAPVKIDGEDAQSYEKMVGKLVDWKADDQPYLARVTPYVVVAASMLGADLEILATYENPAGQRTYHSYLVINRNAIPSQKSSSNEPSELATNQEPKLEQVIQYLRAKESPAKFIFHDKFSTSSFFLPAFIFRDNGIYSMPNSIDSLKAIVTDDINKDKVSGQQRNSSSTLIEKVANGEADVAAVWDVTKKESAFADKVYFVPLPNDLPNDLLVCPSKLDNPTKDALRKAINDMKADQISEGDFKTWIDIEKARDARQALSNLRHLAEQRSTAATIKIDYSPNTQSNPEFPDFKDSIEHAIRLSNTEFEPMDEDYHTNPDVEWFVETIHDKAIRLDSKINYANLASQVFEISYINHEDLSKRIANIIQSSMHRIRYVWPYEDRLPTVIRDVEFPVLPDSVFKVVKIAWKNPKRNDFDEVERFDATVSNVNRFGFQLNGSGFPKTFDPMSNISYRVILVRPTNERPIFTIATYVFVGLLLLAAGGAVFDMRRRAKKTTNAPLVNREIFRQRYRKMAMSYRSSWLSHKLSEADVLWCDRKRLDELIADLNVAGGGNVALNEVRTQKRSMAILASIPVLNKFLNLNVGAAVEVMNVADPKSVSDTKRLADTIKYLMDKNGFSPFIGEKLEWDALNQIAYEFFQPVGKESSPAGTNGDGLIKTEHPLVLSLIANHFNDVIQESKQKVCFFNKNWQVSENENDKTLLCTTELLSPLTLNGKNSTVQKITMHAQVSREAEICDLSHCNEVSAWLLGTIHRVDFPRNGDRTLSLSFRPAALVKTDDSE